LTIVNGPKTKNPSSTIRDEGLLRGTTRITFSS
jgi:hypothetical protein